MGDTLRVRIAETIGRKAAGGIAMTHRDVAELADAVMAELAELTRYDVGLRYLTLAALTDREIKARKQAEAERDKLKAALDRVRALLDSWVSAPPYDDVLMLSSTAADHALAALDGEA